MLEQFRQVNSSSCEAYYRLGQLYEQLGRGEDARRAYRETLQIYRSLPKYNKRKQRRWAILARFKG
ncbi:Tetratricopeptide repeat protein [compost metagenome]